LVASEEQSGLLSPTDPSHPTIRRSQSRAFLSEDGLPQPIEYFLASDPSAIVEHTKKVLYLEDNDIAHITNGGSYSTIIYQNCIFIDCVAMMELRA
jgi:glucosamine--fructose-6-phosphate aminotransferase (isomerizing)